VRYETGESVDDLNISAHVEHYNTESERLKEEIDAVVRQNRQALSQTREFLSSAIERVQLLLGQFHSAFHPVSFISHSRAFMESRAMSLKCWFDLTLSFVSGNPELY